jgi:hypothetical protein
VPVRAGEGLAWLWRPPDATKPRVAVLVSAVPTRPVFDKRIAALNYAGLAVLAVNGKAAQAAALQYLKGAHDLDAKDPILLDPDGLDIDDRSAWAGVVTGPRQQGRGLELHPDRPDLRALVKYALRPSAGL